MQDCGVHACVFFRRRTQVFWILFTLEFCSRQIKILWSIFIINLQPTQPSPPSSSFAAAPQCHGGLGLAEATRRRHPNLLAAAAFLPRRRSPLPSSPPPLPNPITLSHRPGRRHPSPTSPPHARHLRWAGLPPLAFPLRPEIERSTTPNLTLKPNPANPSSDLAGAEEDGHPVLD
jgi:hypothetical protein